MARMSWREACQLDSSLVSLERFFTVPPDYAQTLTGGLTNRCWKIVESNGRAYVWRPTTPITQAFSISRFQEFQILSSIQDSGLSPKPVSINDKGLLVEWLEGASLADSLSFEQLLEALVAVHNVPTTRIPVAPFNFTARVDHYWIQLKPELKSEEYQTIYRDWRNAPSLAEVTATLCHFDLAGYNMVASEAGIQIIDWEYATIGDPRLDLTLSIDVADVDEMEAIHQYCQMRQIEGIDDWFEGVRAWRPRANMMAMLWYLLAFQLWGDEYYYQQAEQLKQQFCT
ncbi:phosphotransferase [Vibrio panuliri]|uniref:Thiamine kinase n=1 Tax=Vibrio panuliri TaxID=1381081 RepID=A0A1Q9HJA3_9VIBR|nr:phosphotransferase [Vibrio panuliri]KAB1454084.1 phosphotransferase [Vibrio panuliri]OLQ88663.1 thiamine kinase [Vibrio panuliri]OLQ90381.1 thiamine kinase [Vibrio panuliri]